MTDDMTDAEKRHDQLTRAPKSSEEDADVPGGATRIDVAGTAVVRPGKPDKRYR